jgi:23S rRNA (pseudouridine1915-N3)-methyltransferase
VRIAVVAVGRSSPAWADEAVADYAKRVGRWVKLDEVRVKNVSFRGDAGAVKTGEGDRVLARLTPRDQLVVMDERGEGLDTHAFTRLIDGYRTGGTHRVVFALGGAYGHSEAVRARAHRTLSLSPMVLNHEVARVVLYEAIYRAFTLLHRVPYDH